MNVGNLKENMTFKNYKALCDFLEIEIMGGNSKQAQLTELARHCRYEKVGHRILIKEVYAAPISEAASRGRKGIYSDILQSLIMDFLVSQNLSEICMSRNSLLIKVGMMNENSAYDDKRIKQLQMIMNFPEEILFDFFNTTNKVFKNSLDGALNGLRHKGYIHFDTALMFAYRIDSATNLLYREATSLEICKMHKLEKLVLDQFGYESMKEVNFSKPRSIKFSKRLIQVFNEQYAKHGEEIRFCYSAHRIRINDQMDKEQLLQFLIKEPAQKVQLQKQLIQSLNEQLLKNAIKRNLQAMESDKTDFITKARRSIQYIPAHKQLIARMIENTEWAAN